MGVVHIKSTPITNADAIPRVVNDGSVTALQLKEAVAAKEVPATSDANSTVRMARVPSSARVAAVIFASAASGATGQVHIGIYETAANGGAVVDADFFASALDPGGGAIASTDVTHEAGGSGFTLAKAEMPLWQALGLTADPNKDYDVALTVAEAIADTTVMKVAVRYGV